MKMLNDNVLILPDAPETMTDFGLIVDPDRPSEGGVKQGTVVFSGSYSDLNPGDHVTFVEYGGTARDFDGRPHIIVPAKNVLAVIGE